MKMKKLLSTVAILALLISPAWADSEDIFGSHGEHGEHGEHGHGYNHGYNGHDHGYHGHGGHGSGGSGGNGGSSGGDPSGGSHGSGSSGTGSGGKSTTSPKQQQQQQQQQSKSNNALGNYFAGLAVCNVFGHLVDTFIVDRGQYGPLGYSANLRKRTYGDQAAVIGNCLVPFIGGLIARKLTGENENKPLAFYTDDSWMRVAHY